MYFTAVQQWDPSQTCRGYVKISEVNQDDDDITLTVVMDYGGGFYSLVRNVIENEMQQVVFKTIKSLSQAMREKDSDENKVKMDKMKREEAKKAVQEANQKTGDEK